MKEEKEEKEEEKGEEKEEKEEEKEEKEEKEEGGGEGGEGGVGRGLTEFSNYAKLCTFEYAWSTGPGGHKLNSAESHLSRSQLSRV